MNNSQIALSITTQLLRDPLHPFPCYRELREHYPVYYSAEFRSWFVTRYHDVQRVIADPVLFSSEQTIRRRAKPPQTNGAQSAPTLLWIDPPRHRQLRSLINQAFTPRTIANLTPRIRAIVHAHIDAIIQRGEMDAVTDLAYPLPIIIIAELLGIPVADQRQFKYWSDVIVSPAREAKKQAVREMNAYFLSVVARRRVEPEDDLISALLAAEIEGDGEERLSDAEILSFCRLLLVAGHETSTNLIGNALLTLDEYPEAWAEICSNPALLPSAIEEVLRYRSPIQRLRRAVTRDLQWGDVLLKAGDIVSPILGAANRDEAQFVDAETFDIHRNPNRHLAFGHGIHFCIGSSLARLETRIALEVILQRFKSLRRIPDIPLQPVASAFVYGVKHLPMAFQVER